MKKKAKKKYAPGELDKTRKNIGKISEEEAKKMAKKLGGEVGIEQDPDKVKSKYKEMRYRSYGRIITSKNRKKRRNRGITQTVNKKDKESSLKKAKKKEKVKKGADLSAEGKEDE